MDTLINFVEYTLFVTDMYFPQGKHMSVIRREDTKIK